MSYTTRDEESTVGACEAFGGRAGECAQIVRRFSAMLAAMELKITEMERQIGNLEDELEACQQELADAKEEA